MENLSWLNYPILAGLKPDEADSVCTGTITITAGTVFFGKVPAAGYGGGVRVVEAFAHIKLGSAATLALVDGGAAGTSVAGTICTFGTSWANAPVAGTPSDYFLDAGDYIGLKWSAGTITSGPALVSVGIIPGK